MSIIHDESSDIIMNLNLIDLMYHDNDVINIFSKYAEANFSELTEKQYEAFFRLLLASRGLNECLEKLEEIRSRIPHPLLVSIANAACLSAGKFNLQLSYLNELETPQGWVAREKVKCLLSCGEYKKATDLIDYLFGKNKEFYGDFCKSILYELNDYERLLEYAPQESKYYAISNYCIANNLKNDFEITSLYTHYSSYQLDLQLYSSSNGGYNISGSLGVTPDRIHKGIVKKLTSNEKNLGILGASLGHIKLIEDFILSNKELLIATESDSYVTFPLIDNLANLALDSNYDFILCSDRHVKPACNGLDISLFDYNYSGRASGFDGYILKRSAAIMILEEFQDRLYDKHIDGEIIDWSSKNAYLKMGLTSVPVFTQSFTSIFSVRTFLELNK